MIDNRQTWFSDLETGFGRIKAHQTHGLPVRFHGTCHLFPWGSMTLGVCVPGKADSGPPCINIPARYEPMTRLNTYLPLPNHQSHRPSILRLSNTS